MDIPQSLLYLILFIYIEGTLGSYLPFTTDPVVLAPFTSLAPLAPHVCEPICEDRCIYGKETDSYGCLLCSCREARSEQCRQAKEYGTCSIKKDPVQRYYFNQTKGECEPFMWEGCESNDNNFISHMDCEHTCGYCKEIVCKHPCPNGYKLDKKGCPTCWCVLKPSKNKECNVKREKCNERKTRFFYNKFTGDCQIYYYGGCSINSNSFLSFEGCRDSCVCDPMVECNLDCDHGFKRDNRGCQICECRPQSCNATICKNDNYCYDKVLDAMGCKTCECKHAKPYSPVYGKHWCPTVCDKTCKYGRVRDFYGCFLCKCRRAQRGLCRLPKKVGPCEAAVSRFFFNTKSGQCEPFTWGGCQPNKNNFNSNSACVNTCGQPGICGLDLKVGPCKAAIPRYYFNAKSGKCEFFSWGGCQPNGNNFKTKQDCVDACAICHKRICRRKYACPLGFKRNKRGCPTCKCVRKPSENSGCNVKRDVGDCGKKEKRYFYNQLTGNCQKFIWKGCEPITSNNFKTIQECKGACVCGPVCAIFCQYGNVPDERGCATCKCRKGPCKLITCLNTLCAPEDRATDEFGCPFCKCRRCFESKEIGPCKAKISRYFYNKTTGKCEQFYWGGCQANGNNFKTLWHCKRFCEV